MKLNKIAYVLLLTGIFATSCQDEFLDKAPLDRYTDAVVWEDPTLIDAFLLTQYMYTPVLVNDATTMFTSWSGSPMNRDSRGNDVNYFFGNSAQVFGTRLTMDVSDETKYNLGSWADLAGVKAFGITPDGGVLEYWDNAYYTVRNLNEFIERVPNSSVDTQLATLRTAEARFLRAYIYFSMAKRYGGVPLITSVPQLNSPEELLYPKRNSEKEIYDFVISETTDIAEPLAATTDYGRATKWAALSLKCRAALFAGSIAQFGQVQLNGLLGIPSGESTEYYQIAYDAAKDIIQNGGFALYHQDADKVQNFKNLFLVKRNSEVIMAKQHDGAGFVDGGFNTWSWDAMQCPQPQVWGTGNENAPYLEMAEEFEKIDGTPGTLDRTAIQQGLWTMDEIWKDRDPRFYASIWTNETPWRDANGGHLGSNFVDMHIGIIKPDGTIVTGVNDSYEGVNAVGSQYTLPAQWGVVTTGFGIMKYLDPTADNMKWLAESRTDYQIFRYGETLLNFAEAAFELGKTGDALDAVNQIRDRAGIAQLTSIDRQKIRHERKVELAFENHRYWDLRRWREAETKLTRSFSGLQYILDYETKKYKILVVDDVDGATTPPQFPSHNYYFPITKARIAANSNLVENPGY